MKNGDIAKIFREIADLLELQDNSYRPQAYRRAARSIEQLDEELTDIAARGELEDIYGIGKALAKKIQELLDTGESKVLNQLKGKIEPGLIELLNIPDLGPKKVQILHHELGITTIEDLQMALDEHKVQTLPGFGPSSEDRLRQNLELVMGTAKRKTINVALPIAEEFVEDLRRLPEVKQISIAGSLRRWKETIGDIDILVSSASPEVVMQQFLEHPKVARILAQGPTKSSILSNEDMQIDLRVVEDASFGAALQYFTGSKAHNIALRSLARRRNWKLSEYHLLDVKTNKVIAGKTEETIYKALGLDWIPPALREDQGEIEAAQKHTLPKLIQIKDIRGDLHVHTKWTNGESTIEEMANAAMQLGYEYLAICDHSQQDPFVKGLDDKRLLDQIARIRELDEELDNFHLMAGIEAEILPDGSLDLTADVLSETDIVIAAIHLPRDTKAPITDLLINACHHDQVDMIAHLTGRIINKRPSFSIDLDAVLDAVKTQGIFLEINSYYVDPSSELTYRAKAKGIKFVINTDAHHFHKLDAIRYGVGLANRAWIEAKDVINTQSFSKLRKTLKHVH